MEWIDRWSGLCSGVSVELAIWCVDARTQCPNGRLMGRDERRPGELSNVLKTMKCLLYLSASRLLAAWSTLLADGAPALCLTASRYRSSDVHRHGSAHSRVRSLDANRVDDGFGRDARSQFGNFLFAAGGCIVDVKSRGVGWMWSEKKRTGCEKAVREGERGGW